MESKLHGVLNRRPQWVRDAKRDGGTGGGEEQEANMAHISWLEGCASLPTAFCKSIIPKDTNVFCFDRLLQAYHSWRLRRAKGQGTGNRALECWKVPQTRPGCK